MIERNDAHGLQEHAKKDEVGIDAVLDEGLPIVHVDGCPGFDEVTDWITMYIARFWSTVVNAVPENPQRSCMIHTCLDY